MLLRHLALKQTAVIQQRAGDVAPPERRTTAITRPVASPEQSNQSFAQVLASTIPSQNGTIQANLDDQRPVARRSSKLDSVQPTPATTPQSGSHPGLTQGNAPTTEATEVPTTATAPSTKLIPAPATPVNWDGESAKIAGVPFADLIVSTAKRYGVSPSLVAAVVKAESEFNPLAQSGAGAKGLMQLMDGTARSLGVTNVFDPAQNVEGGIKYLDSLLKKYSGNVSLALAAYNAGPGAVDEFGGIPPYEETTAYVSRVLGYWRGFGGGSQS